MVRRSEGGHLVPVPGVLEEEVLHLLRDLLRGEEGAPFVGELREHAPRAALFDLAQPAKDRQLVVRHAHVRFVRLDVRLRDGLELGGRHCFQEAAGGTEKFQLVREGEVQEARTL